VAQRRKADARSSRTEIGGRERHYSADSKVLSPDGIEPVPIPASLDALDSPIIDAVGTDGVEQNVGPLRALLPTSHHIAEWLSRGAPGVRRKIT
jgi:hypothetical protein